MVFLIDLLSKQFSIIFLDFLVPTKFLIMPSLTSLLLDFDALTDKSLFFNISFLIRIDIGISMVGLIIKKHLIVLNAIKGTFL